MEFLQLQAANCKRFLPISRNDVYPNVIFGYIPELYQTNPCFSQKIFRNNIVVVTIIKQYQNGNLIQFSIDNEQLFNGTLALIVGIVSLKFSTELLLNITRLKENTSSICFCNICKFLADHSIFQQSLFHSFYFILSTQTSSYMSATHVLDA